MESLLIYCGVCLIIAALNNLIMFLENDYWKTIFKKSNLNYIFQQLSH